MQIIAQYNPFQVQNEQTLATDNDAQSLEPYVHCAHLSNQGNSATKKKLTNMMGGSLMSIEELRINKGLLKEISKYKKEGMEKK